jgi:hypothetical protein
VATAILSASDFKTFNYGEDTTIYQLKDALFSIDKGMTMKAVSQALRDERPRVQRFAVTCLYWMTNRATLPAFSLTAEPLFKLAAGSDVDSRIFALAILAEILPLTKLEPVEFSTAERRELVAHLTENFPRSTIIALHVSALSDRHVDVALWGAECLTSLPEYTDDVGNLAKLVDRMTQIALGKTGESSPSREQRGRALITLNSLGPKAAAATPTLIELLKSNDPDLKHGTLSFSKHQIGDVLASIGPPAAVALPELELMLAQSVIEEKENALLKINPKELEIKHVKSEFLRRVIRKIKGEDRED